MENKPTRRTKTSRIQLRKMSKGVKILSLAVITALLVGALFAIIPLQKAKAEISGAPQNSKELIDNGDGTYTIALSVTGAAESSITTEATKANVILVLDTSSSMVNNRPGGQGTRTRLALEQEALTKDDGIIDKLLAQNVPGDSVKKDIIEIAIVDFGNRGNVTQTWETDPTVLKNAINTLTTTSGTNWEEGLRNARTLADAKKTAQPDEEVYVIFMTDGEPTTHYNSYNVNWQNVTAEWRAAVDDARGIVATGTAPGSASRYHFYALFTWGAANNAHYLSSLVHHAYSGWTGNINDLSTNAALTADEAQYYTNADSTDAVIAALSQIVDDITNSVGYTDVEMTDGVTEMTASNVKASASGEVTGLKYYRSGGSYSTTANDGLGEEWTDAPQATINSAGEVDWDLGSIILEDGVTYTITFVVWPKQESLDLVADLNNGVIRYSDLTPAQQAQIAGSAGSYTLKTNTDYPTVTYSTVTTITDSSGTHTEKSDPVTIDMVNPPPVSLTESKLNAIKRWEDTLDPSQREEIEDVVLYLLVDGDYYYKNSDGTPMGVTLTEESKWQETDYISIAPGLMVTEDSPAYDPDATHVTWNGTTYAIIEDGHDYVFEESDINNHFELTAYTHHPMIMGKNSDGTLHVVDVVFIKDGNTITGIESVAELGDNLSATNTLKGGINITKKVVNEAGEEINNTDPFEITVTLTDPEGNTLPTKKTADGTEYTIDYRIYYGPNNPNYDEASGGGRSNHIYVSGTSFTETIYVGDTIRVVNVEDDSLYTVEETEKTGYELVGIKYSIAYGTEGPRELEEDEDPTVQGNSASYAEITNKYTFGDLEVSKTVTVESGNEEQAKAKEFEFTFKLYSDANKTTELEGQKYNYTITKADGSTTNGTITEGGTFKLKDSEKILIKSLPEAAYYEITETAVDGYTTTPDGGIASGTIVKDDTAKAAFTNTYSVEPVIIDPPVQKVLIVPEGATAPDIEGAFTFTITNTAKPSSVETAPMPKNTVITNSEAYLKVGTTDLYEFGEIEFTVPGTYVYRVTESGTVPGITNDGDADTGKTLTVVVTDNGSGELSMTVTPDTEQWTFTNTYKVGELDITKTVVVESGDEEKAKEQEFTFTITLTNGTTALSGSYQYTVYEGDTATETTGTIQSGGTLKLKDGQTAKIVQIPDGTTYTVTETAVDGFETDPEDGASGTITGTATAAFTNTYSVEPTTVSFPAEKVLEVPTGLTGPDITEAYTFTLTAGDGVPMPTTTSYKNPSANGGTVTFGEITFTAPGTYEYTVTETGTVAGVTNDKDAATGKKVTVTVTDNGDGTLTATASATSDAPVTFTNTYGVTPTTVSFPVEKVLEVPTGLTGPDITEAYTFTLTAGDGVPMPTTTSYKNPSANGGTVTFGEITYTAPGTYTYTVTETGTVAGVTNDSTAAKTVTVTVTDEGDGTLSATASSTTDDPLTFTNTYSVTPTTIKIPVEKILSYAEGLTPDDITGKFTFTLTAGSGVPMPETTSYTNPDADGGSVEFGEIEYTVAGTYTYTVTETGSADGVHNDATASKSVIVTVVDNKDGTLTASLSQAKITFTNSYDVGKVTASIPVKKVLEVPTGLTGPDITSAYTFTLTADSGVPMPATTSYKNPAADGGMVQFGEIEFSAPGTYTYTVTESGTVKGVANDTTTAKTVTIEVVDNGDGTLTATPSSTTEAPLTFTNTYSVEPTTAEIPVEKILSYAEDLTPDDITGKFTFTLTADSGVPMPTTTSYTNPSADGGTVTFGDITYSAPGEYTYTVTETGSADGVTNDSTGSKTVKITVTDNGDGTLTAELSQEEITFTNVYDVKPVTASFDVEKVLLIPEGLTGPADITGSFTFTLTGADGAPMPATTSYTNPSADGGTVTFGAIEFTAPGTYAYTVTETGSVDGVTNDTAGSKTVTITVTDNGDGTLTAAVSQETVTFTNTYDAKGDATIVVKKALSGAGWPEGKTLTFTLTGADGAPMPETTEVKLTAEGSVYFGPVSFTAGDIGRSYTYTITEDGFGGDWKGSGDITVTIDVLEDNGDGTLKIEVDYPDGDTITNTYEKPPIKTGDYFRVLPYVIALSASGLGAAGTGTWIGLKKKRERKENM